MGEQLYRGKSSVYFLCRYCRVERRKNGDVFPSISPLVSLLFYPLSDRVCERESRALRSSLVLWVSAPRCTVRLSFLRSLPAGEIGWYRPGLATGDSDAASGAQPPVPQSFSSGRSRVTPFLLLPVVPEAQPTYPSFVPVPFVAARTVQSYRGSVLRRRKNLLHPSFSPAPQFFPR